MVSTLTTLCQWEDEMTREGTGHLTLYAEDKKMKWLTLHTHGWLKGLIFFYVHG